MDGSTVWVPSGHGLGWVMGWSLFDIKDVHGLRWGTKRSCITSGDGRGLRACTKETQADTCGDWRELAGMVSRA